MESLRIIDDNHLYPRMPVIEAGLSTPTVCIAGREYLTFASNDYLGLASDPRTQEAAIKAMRQAGVGPGHSRAIGGTPKIVEDLEERIAQWTGFEACVTFPTGYMANVSVIQALTRPLFDPQGGAEPVVFLDQACHGSLVDGCKLAGARIVPFRHNEPSDLERKLARHRAENGLIVTEGVFCLEGTVIDLPAYVVLARRFEVPLMVDDAHGIGILGPQGGGAASGLATTDGVEVYMGSMDKALGSTGGFLCGDLDLIRYLRVACHSQLLSSCIPVPVAGSVMEAIRVLRDSRDSVRRIIERATVLRGRLVDLGFEVAGNPDHPSVSVIVGDDGKGLCFEHGLWEAGIFQPVMRWPAVPLNKCRFPINVSALHTEEHVARLVSALDCLRQGLA